MYPLWGVPRPTIMGRRDSKGMRVLSTSSSVQKDMARPFARISKALLAVGLSAGLGCSPSFPGGSPAENVLAALLLFGNFGLSPTSLPFVAAGATYKFTLSGGVGSPQYSVSECGTGSDVDASTGVFRAPKADATACVVTARDAIGSTRSATVTVKTYPTVIKDHGSALHAYFPLDGSIADASGNAQPSTAVPGPLMTFDPAGGLSTTVYASNQSMRLNGTTETVNGISGFDPATAASGAGFSAEIWFRVAGADTVVNAAPLALISQYSCAAGTPRIWLGIDANAQDQVMTQLGGVTNRSGITVKSGRTYHAVVTVKGSALNLYVNGIIRKSTTIVTETCTTPSPLAIGSFAGVSFFAGNVDQAAMYQTELSAADVTRHYLTGLAKTVAIDDISTYAAYGNSRGFYAFGGVPPYVYKSDNLLQEDAIDAASGLYRPPSLSATSSAVATEQIHATDAAGNVADLSVSVVAFPNSFANLNAWWSAETVTNVDNGLAVPIFLDISGTGMNLTNIPGTKPRFMNPTSAGLNGFPALDFPVPLDQLDSGSGFGTIGDLTLFVVAFVSGNGIILSHDELVAGTPEFVNYQLAASGGNLVFRHQSAAGTYPTATGGVVTPFGNWRLLAARRTSGTTVAVAVDGAITNPALSIVAAPVDGSNGKLHLGRTTVTHDNGDPGFNGRIAEIAIFHRALSDSEVTQMHCYFKNKYGAGTSIATSCP